VWVGVDNAWEQKKLEARKMLESAAESHTSGARFVGWRFVVQDALAEKKHCRQTEKIIARTLYMSNHQKTIYSKGKTIRFLCF